METKPTLILSPEVVSGYESLIEHISQYEKKLMAQYRDNIECEKGCSSCCSLHTVFPLEAAILCAELKDLPPKMMELIKANSEESKKNKSAECPLLIKGACSLYRCRPIICRTHGYPIFNQGKIDFCYLNFRGVKTLPSEMVINLEQLNRIIVLLNRKFMKDQTTNLFAKMRHKEGRIYLDDLLTFAESADFSAFSAFSFVK